MMFNSVWIPIKDGDLRAFGLYRRHYSYRARPVTKLRQIAPPCRHLMLLTPEQDALWLWTAEQFRHDGQTGICCAIFRNEGAHLSSDLILAAEEWGREYFGPSRMYTYIAPDKILSANPGYCFKMAGWQTRGQSKRGLHILVKE